MALPQKPERESWQFDVDSIEEILQETGSESVVEDENAKDTRSKVKVRKTKKFAGRKGKAWLKGGKADASLDFLDLSVLRRVLATKPDLAKDTQSAEPIKHNFKSFPDRRLLSSEMEEEEGKVKGKKNQGGKARRGSRGGMERWTIWGNKGKNCLH